MRHVHQWKCVLLIVINIQTSLPFLSTNNYSKRRGRRLLHQSTTTMSMHTTKMVEEDDDDDGVAIMMDDDGDDGNNFFSSSPPSPTRVKDTKVIVDGRATVVIDTLPRQQDDIALSDNVTLTDYMQLPVEQYVLIPMPLGSNLRKLESNFGESSVLSGDLLSSSSSLMNASEICTTEFELTVPTIKFFKLSLQPVVYATVQPYHDRVIISSTKCRLGGSPFIEKVKLNDRFDFSVNTTLTWEDEDLTTTNYKIHKHNNLGVVKQQERVIIAETCICVDIDIPKPFNTIPKRLIERAGNAAMKVSLNYIQANFVNNLAIDYIKWSSDSDYRQYRASLSTKE